MLDKFKELSLIMRLVALVAVAGVLTGAAYFLVFKTMEEENAQKQTELNTLNEEVAQLRTFEPKLADLERQIAQLQMQIEIQKKIVPDEKEVDNFIRVMQETAADAGIDIRRYVAKNSTNKEFYSEVPFDIELDGPFYSMLNFFDRVGKLERIINVANLEMGGLKTGRGAKRAWQSPSATVSAKATAVTFFSREPQQTPAPAAPAAK